MEKRTIEIERFCETLDMWAGLMADKDPGFARAWDVVRLGISKSNLLARMIYGGEELRTRPCPIHKGRWSGIFPCPEGCGETGWLPNDWPEAYPFCDQHPEARAVATIHSLRSGESPKRLVCYECYQAAFNRRGK